MSRQYKGSELAPDIANPTIAMVDQLGQEFWSLVLHPDFPVSTKPDSVRGLAIGSKQSELVWQADVNGIPLRIQSRKYNIGHLATLRDANVMLTVGENTDSSAQALTGSNLSVYIGHRGRTSLRGVNHDTQKEQIAQLLQATGAQDKLSLIATLEEYATTHEPDITTLAASYKATIRRGDFSDYARIQGRLVQDSDDGQVRVAQQLGVSIDHAFAFDSLASVTGWTDPVLNWVSLEDERATPARDSITELSPMMAQISRVGHLLVSQAQHLVTTPTPELVLPTMST